MIGRVTSVKMKNTATVLVERLAKHCLYKKTFTRSKKYLAEVKSDLTETGVEIKEGDVVEMVKIRPISKRKHWQIIKVVGKNLTEITEQELKAEAEKIVSEVMPEEKGESRVKSLESGKETAVKSKRKGGKS